MRFFKKSNNIDRHEIVPHEIKTEFGKALIHANKKEVIKLIEKYNIKDKVELILEKGYIILKPISKPRKDWEQAFKKMNENGDDQLLFNDVFENENLEEWN